MSQYQYLPLSNRSKNIRLLRLFPAEAEKAKIRGELLEHRLQTSSRPSYEASSSVRGSLGPVQSIFIGDEHRLQTSSRSSYEALSYVWGSIGPVQSILIGDEHLDVTPNLYAALVRLRDASFPRIIWIDAICINQADDNEKSEQIQIMAEIYGKATRVLIWLGESANDSDDALESIRARGAVSIDDRETKRMEQAVMSLLQREWFERIWILQEVAAARSVLVICGAVEIDGYAFCLGLEDFKELLSKLRTQVHTVTYLIQGAIFRPRLVTNRSARASLNICSLAELVSMYHTHQATRRHDKIYALQGMASDDLSKSGLLPDYKVPWADLLYRLTRYIVGDGVQIKTWSDGEKLSLYGNGRALGYIDRVTKTRSGGQTVDIILSNAQNDGQRTQQWTFPAMGNDIRRHDIVYHIQGASKPCILRAHGFLFIVVMIASEFPYKRSKTFPYTLQLVWDWAKLPRTQELWAPEAIERGLSPWRSAIILEDLKDYTGAKTEALRMTAWLSERGNRIHITEEYVLAVMTRSHSVCVPGVLDLLGHRAPMTEAIVTAIVQYQELNLVRRVLEGEGAKFESTHTLVLAAARNMNYGHLILPLLLDRNGYDTGDQISEAALIAVVKNKHCRREMMHYLHDSIHNKWEGDEIITEAILLVVASENDSDIVEAMEYLLKERGEKIHITEALLVAAAANEMAGKHILKLFLCYGREIIMVTDSVLTAAAANKVSGNQILYILLEQGPKRTTISQAVLAAAAGNKWCGKEIVKILWMYIPEALDVYIAMGGKREDISLPPDT